jgi:hypothetical protein
MTNLTKLELIEEIKERKIQIKNLQKLKKDELIQILSENPVIVSKEEAEKSDIPVLYPISLSKK